MRPDNFYSGSNLRPWVPSYQITNGSEGLWIHSLTSCKHNTDGGKLIKKRHKDTYWYKFLIFFYNLVNTASVRFLTWHRNDAFLQTYTYLGVMPDHVQQQTCCINLSRGLGPRLLEDNPHHSRPCLARPSHNEKPFLFCHEHQLLKLLRVAHLLIAELHLLPK